MTAPARSVQVRAGRKPYPVLIDAGLVQAAGREIAERLETGRAVVLADAGAEKHHGQALRRSLKAGKVKILAWETLPAGEKTKSLTRARALYTKLIEAGVDRWTPIIGFGGGVTGDLAGFVASTLYRGLPLVQIPTTVVAQVDSSVGGKTAVNFAGAKNLIGTFYQPDLVLADPELLATLARRDYRAGLAEVTKIAVTLRPDLMKQLETSMPEILSHKPDLLVDMIGACVSAKAEVVGRDETDRDVRGILNYGHTVGHALEAAMNGRLRHGEAVAVGMQAAALLGQDLGVTDPEVLRRQTEVLKSAGLKLTAPSADKLEVARNLKLDKKVRDHKLRFVLTLKIGGASVWPHVPGGLVKRVVQSVTS